MEWFVNTYLQNCEGNCTIVDLGSQCVVGQEDTYRKFFKHKSIDYVGVDMVAGHNVDIVLSTPYDWKEISDDYCDVLICGQVFEHIEFPWVTIKEISRIVKPDGLICIIVPSMQELHRYPVNTYNYFADGMLALCKWAGILPLHCSTGLAPRGESTDFYSSHADTMLIAKNTKSTYKELDLSQYQCEPADLDKISTKFISVNKQPYYKKYLVNKVLYFVGGLLKRRANKAFLSIKNLFYKR